MMNVFRFGAPGLVALVLTFVVHAAAAQPPLPALDDLLAQFDDVAFGHEHGPSRHILQRWERGPQLALFADPGYDVRPELGRIGKVTDQIAGLTGLQVHSALRGQDISLRFGFYPRRDFRKLPLHKANADVAAFFATSACIAVAVNDPEQPGRISAGAIVVGTDISERVRKHCILEEMVQVLGLPNDACHYRPSLFCEDDYVMEMTPADRLLLQALYDNRLRPGMKRAEAMPIIRTILAEAVAAPATATASVAE